MNLSNPIANPNSSNSFNKTSSISTVIPRLSIINGNPSKKNVGAIKKKNYRSAEQALEPPALDGVGQTELFIGSSSISVMEGGIYGGGVARKTSYN